MTTHSPQPLSEDLRRRVANLRLVAFDVDGTLTDGRLWFDDSGREAKSFHVHDGMGLRLLEDNGITVALITARLSAVVEARGSELRLQHVFTGIKDKRACLDALCAQLSIDLNEVAYMGDDLPDLPIFGHAGLSATPADAHPWMIEHADWVSRHRGGEGAARELCDLILEQRGLKPVILAGYRPT